MPLTNRVSILLPPSTRVFVQAMANAAATQTVTITPPAGVAAVFKGNGEGNVNLPLVTPGFLTVAPPSGQPSFVTPAGGGAYKVTVVSALPNPSVVTGGKMAVQNPNGGDFGVAWALSEDGGGTDYNDSVVLFTYYSPAPPI